MLTSPELASPPPIAPRIHGSNTNKAVQSPVVGEVKGWFSHIFGWKNNHQLPAGTGILYSSDPVHQAHADVKRLLHSFGAFIDEESATTRLEDGMEILGLRCRVDEASAVHVAAGGSGSSGHALGLLGSKGVRFRVQIYPCPQSSPPSSATTPTPATMAKAARQSLSTPSQPPTPQPGAYQDRPFSGHGDELITAIVLIHQRGSSSTFKAVWKRMRDMYEGSAKKSRSSGSGGVTPMARDYPIMSPTVGATPTIDQTMRFAI